MASFVYNKAAQEIGDGTIDLDSTTLKVMLVTSVYTPDKDDLVVDAGGGSDAADAEISVANYTPGWGSASRKTAVVSHDHVRLTTPRRREEERCRGTTAIAPSARS